MFKFSRQKEPAPIYKFRPYAPHTLEAIENNYLWAARLEELNDPFETICDLSDLNGKPGLGRLGFKSYRRLYFSELGFAVAFICMSKVLNKELLWAHYADSHRGLCVEYDLHALAASLERHISIVNVRYKPDPPMISFLDLIDKPRMPWLHRIFRPTSLLQLLVGYKSKAWKYEQETRIVVRNKGKHYHNPAAIRAIYFGLRMTEKDKMEIVSRLERRAIRFFEMILEPNRYRLRPKEIVGLTAFRGSENRKRKVEQ